jgi:glycerol-3-phosphate dehydrogenase
LKRPFPGAILPNDDLVGQIVAKYRDRFSIDTLYHLLDTYGKKAEDVLALVDETPELGAQIVPELPDIQAQVVYAVQSEYAHHMLDILRRRTAIAMMSCYGLSALKTVSEVLQQYCGWSAEQCDRQMAEYRAYMEGNCIPDYALSSTRRSVPEAVSA